MQYQLAKDFKFTDKFNALREQLTKEFLAQFPDFCEEQFVDPEQTNNPHGAKTVSLWKSAGNAAAGDAWKVEGLKYQDSVSWPVFCCFVHAPNSCLATLF